MVNATRIIVRGLVQGVFFRDSVRKEAQELGLTGTVMNKSDGSVEIILFGEENNVDSLVRWCYIGPPLSEVESVEVSEIEVEHVLKDFRVIG